MKKFLFAFMFIFAVAADQDISSALQSLEDKIPADLLPALPGLNEGEDMLKEKCLKNGNNETYDLVMEAKEELQTCVKNLFDVEKMKKEIEKAKPTGDLDTVFRKYCRKSPDLKGCIETFLNASEPCLDESEKSHKMIALNITDAMVNFICFKEGDRIALFIAEGGPECLESKTEEIQICLNETLGTYVEGKDVTTDRLPTLLLDEKQCMDINRVQACVVKHLEKCAEPTPANIVGSMFDFVKKNTPCKKYLRNAAVSMSTTLLSLAVPMFAFVLSKL